MYCFARQVVTARRAGPSRGDHPGAHRHLSPDARDAGLRQDGSAVRHGGRRGAHTAGEACRGARSVRGRW